MHQFHPFQNGIHSFHIGAGLVATLDVINTPESVRAFDDLQAAIFPSRTVYREHATRSN